MSRIPADLLRDNPGIGDWCILHAWRGSVAHGMYEPPTNPLSIDDKDTMGVCVPPLDHYFGLSDFGSRGTQEIKHGEWDIVTYEARKALRMLTQGNPNILAMLWLPDNGYIKRSPAGNLLLDHRDLFVGRHVYEPFVGYAKGQLAKMTRSNNPVGASGEIAYLGGLFDGEGHVSIARSSPRGGAKAPMYQLSVGITGTDEGIIDWLREAYGGFVGRTGIRGGHRKDAWRWRLGGPQAARFLELIRPVLRIKKEQADIAIRFQKSVSNRPVGRALREDEIEQREAFRQALLSARTLSSPLQALAEEREFRDDAPYIHAYMGAKRKEIVERFGYDTKNAAHLIRLLRMGIEFLREGYLRVDRGGLDATELLDIKHGKWTLDEVQKESQRLFERAETAYDACTLPTGPDRAKINDLCVEIVAKAQEGRE